MEDKIVKVAAIGFVGLVVAPIVIGGVINLAGAIYVTTANTVNRAKYNKKIKKGIKEGTIVKIDGQYYEVQVGEEA